MLQEGYRDSRWWRLLSLGFVFLNNLHTKTMKMGGDRKKSFFAKSVNESLQPLIGARQAGLPRLLACCCLLRPSFSLGLD